MFYNETFFFYIYIYVFLKVLECNVNMFIGEYIN